MHKHVPSFFCKHSSFWVFGASAGLLANFLL